MNRAEQSPPIAPVRVEHATKRFYQGSAAVAAIRDVSLEVRRGEFLAVMGASGSGKSTLLHLMAGLTQPDQGRIFVDGQNLAVMSDRNRTQFRRRHIGLVFQAFNLIPTLTAEENILLPLLCDGRADRHKETLDELVGLLDLADRRRHRPDALSGGEQQRVAIARALAANPSIILADEPTGSLDSVSGQSLCRLLRDLCEQQHRTIVVVTHEASVAAWAQRVVVLKDGSTWDQFSTSEFDGANALAAHYQAVVLAGSTEVPA